MPDAKNSLSPEAINIYLLGGVNTAFCYTKTYYYWKKFQSIYRILKDEIKVKTGPIKIIDVGCAFGGNVFLLNHDFGREHDLEFFGVDLNPTEIYCCNLKKEKYQTGNFTFTVMSAESLDYPDNSFDILFSIEVLEHLQRPARAINEFYRVLKPGGLAIITTPNRSTLISKPRKILESVLERAGKARSSAREEMKNSVPGKSNDADEQAGYGHISVKGLKEWIEILSESGFKTEKIRKGSLLRGSLRLDRKRAVMALVLMAEIFLDRLPLFKNLSEDVILSARKIIID